MKHKLLVLGTIALMASGCNQKNDIDNKIDEPKRVQVKTIYRDKRHDRYICNVTLTHRQRDGSMKVKKYDENAFDYCAAVCREQNAIYILPVECVAGRRGITFYPDKEGVVDTKRYRHFEQYKYALLSNE